MLWPLMLRLPDGWTERGTFTLAATTQGQSKRSTTQPEQHRSTLPRTQRLAGCCLRWTNPRPPSLPSTLRRIWVIRGCCLNCQSPWGSHATGKDARNDTGN